MLLSGLTSRCNSSGKELSVLIAQFYPGNGVYLIVEIYFDNWKVIAVLCWPDFDTDLDLYTKNKHLNQEVRVCRPWNTCPLRHCILFGALISRALSSCWNELGFEPSFANYDILL